jgi:isopenicillin-N epimerase
VPTALQFLGSLLHGGIAELQRHNHELAVRSRDKLCKAIGTEPPAPAAMLGSLASVLLRPSELPAAPPHGLDALQVALWERHRIEVPVMRWAQPKLRMLRISPQAYNSDAQYDFLADAVRALEPRA